MIIIFQPARGGLTKGGEGHYFNEYDKKNLLKFQYKLLKLSLSTSCFTVSQ